MDARRNNQYFDGWHDIHVKIEGPATQHVLENFAERWNAKKSKIYTNSIKREVAQVNKNFSDPKSPDYFASFESIDYRKLKKVMKPIIGIFDIAETLPYISVDNAKIKLSKFDFQANGTCDVQINRTISQRSTEKIPYDYSVLKAFQKAIKSAQHYIYLEDQYFWKSDTLFKTFVAAAKRGVKIIALSVCESDQGPGALRGYHLEARYKLFTALNKASTTGQAAFIYHLKPLTYLPPAEGASEEDKINHDKKAQIYVHSKLMIIDDNFVSIGSANLNDRSMTYDSELACSIVDGEKSIGPMGNLKKFDKNKFALNLRKRIWSQILGVPETRINNPFKTNSKGELVPNGWPTKTKRRKNLAELHEMTAIKTSKLIYSGKEDLMNPRPVDLKVKY